jgi:hypothetical protein
LQHNDSKWDDDEQDLSNRAHQRTHSNEEGSDQQTGYAPNIECASTDDY